MDEYYGRSGTGELIGRYDTHDEPDTPLTTFVVIKRTPGYLPDDLDRFETTDYSAAVRYANELADELEDDGYDCDRRWAVKRQLLGGLLHARQD